MNRQDLHTDTLIGVIMQLQHTSNKGVTFISGNAEEEVLPYDQLLQEAMRMLGALQQRGIHTGDELILQVEDNRKFIVLFWACLLGKIIPVPLSTGSQDDHKLKLIKVFQNLHQPYLICDRLQLERLEKYAAANAQDTVFSAIEKNTLLLEEFTAADHPGIVCEVTPRDIAYIQFSSGSTGEPKGVILTHANLVANISDIAFRSDVTADDRMLSWMPLTHDMGLICFHLTGMIAGAAQYLMPTALFVRRPILWIEKASEHRISLLYSPNFGYSYFLTAFNNLLRENIKWDLSAVRIIYNGAEPISHELCDRFISTLGQYGMPATAMYPGYGMAEASVAVCLPDPGNPLRSYNADRTSLQTGKKVKLVTPEDKTAVSFMEVGYPIPQCRVRIADDDDNVMEQGVLGNVQITGANVTAGYYNNPVATGKIFTPDGWVRTGDLGFFQNERLVITGRAKNIIILNGQNYYPQDIERAAERVEGVGPGKIVACGVKNPGSWKEELVVFVLFKDKLPQFVSLLAVLRDAVSEQTGLMVDTFIPVTKIPKTTSGKVQHYKLVEAYQSGQFDQLVAEINELQHKATLTATPEEIIAWLLDVCRNILGIKDIGITDNLFEWGITSLQATQLAVHIRERSGKEFNAWEVLCNPTIKGIAEMVSEDRGEKVAPSVIVAPASPGNQYPLSEGQRRFWLLHQHEEAQPACNIATGYWLNGEVNAVVLEKAFRSLMERHESLRTTFVHTTDGPVQVIHPVQDAVYSFEHIDLRPLTEPETKAGLLAQKDADTAFDIEKGPLWKCKLVQVADDKHLLTFTIHHSICDGWSVLLAFREIAVLYNAYVTNNDPGLKPLLLQAKDYAYNQQQRVNDVNQAYWRNTLQGELPVLDLPFKQSRPAFQTFAGNTKWFTLSDDTTNRLSQLGRKNESTLFMTLLTLVNILFYKYTGQTDIVIGTDTAGRDEKELEKQIGYFLRTLPVRTRFDRQGTVQDLLRTVKDNLVNAYKHQDYSFDSLLKEIDTKKDIRRSLLFDVLVIYQNFEDVNGFRKIGDTIDVTPCTIDSASSLLDLHIEFIERNGALAYNIRYNTDLFSETQVEQMGRHFAQLADTVSANPDQAIAACNMLDKAEKRKLLADFNATETQYQRYGNLAALFEEQVAKTPASIAVRFGGEAFTYDTINRKANQFAHFLANEYGAGPGVNIGLLVTPSEKMIVQLMGIYKTGAVLVPLTTEFPAERIRQITANSDTRLICTDRATEDLVKHLPVETIPGEMFWELADQYPQENPVPVTSGDDTAYIMYTSGSTGTPKGVVVAHEAVIDYVQTFSRYFNLAADDIVIQQSELTFDTSVEEIFPALSTGGAIIVMSNRGRNVDDILEAITVNKATILSTTPLVLNEINKHADAVKSLRVIISGGDKLKPAFIDKLVHTTAVFNTYGPTESTVCTTFHRLADAADVAIIGQPIANRQVFILDEDGKPVPVGVKGEIYIGGKGLAQGYLANEEETNRSFIYSSLVNGQRLYKSGDLGRWLYNGTIEFLGRKDGQVKINGYRVETGEVEQAMLNLEEVSDAAVITNRDKKGNLQLVAYYTGQHTDTKYFRSRLMDAVPHYMVPSFFVHLDAMPVNTNGKTDRKALPAVQLAAPVSEQDGYTAIANKTEEKLVLIWKEVLSETEINVTDNFFELGGNSIAATRIAARIQKEFNTKFLLKNLFIYPTVREQATLLTGNEPALVQPIPVLEEKNSYDVSHAQKRLWLLDQFKEAKLAYNLSWAFELGGELQVELFRKAIHTLIERHEILRTTIVTIDGAPQQQIQPVTGFSFAFRYENLEQDNTGLTAEEIVEEETTYSFDLAADQLIRASVVRLSDTHHVFVFVIHHIIADGWSMQVIVDELVTIYNDLVKGKEALLPALPFQYKDFAAWQNERFADEQLNEHKNYWINRFSGAAIPVLEMPTDYPRPVVQTYNGDVRTFFIPEAGKRKLAAIGSENDTTLFVVLLSAVYTLLHKYSRQEDIVIGTPVIGREREDLENQVGLYLNTLALRTTFRKGDSFRTLLNRVKTTVLQAYEHQEYPFDWLVDELSPVSDTSRSPLFDIMVGYQDTEKALRKLNTLEGLTVSPYEKKNIISQFDLSIDFFEKEEGIAAAIEFNTDLFKPAFIERFIGQYLTLLDAVVANTGLPLHAIEYIPVEQKKQLLDFNGPQWTPSDYESFAEVFEETAGLFPDETAVAFGEETLTYNQLNNRANQLAHYLREQHGVEPNDVIGLLTGRSADMIVYLLGILKAGAAYLPIDADHLSGRVDFLVTDSNMKLLLAAGPYMTDAPVETIDLSTISDELDTYTTGNPSLVNKPGDLVYIIYTSGSTGNPKGVMVQHQHLLSISESWQLHYELDSFPVCVLQMASISFDVFMGDVCRSLINGGKLVICPADTRPDVQKLYELVAKHRVSVLESTPALVLPLMEYVYESQLDVSFIKLLIIGSDTCLIEDYKGLQTRFGSQMRIINSYGTTETTIDSSYYEEPVQNLPVTGTTPIGRPLANTQYFVLDDHQMILPISVPGELCIGGAGVSGGYLHNEDLQKKKFIADPFNKGAKLYRTGDIVRWQDDGNIQFMGRGDFQVKIRGYRIELGEIEDALLRYDGVRDTVVVARKDGEGDQYLAGYYVMEEGKEADEAGLRSWLNDRLPSYMVPSNLMLMPSLPLTSNGKVDRKALPAPVLTRQTDIHVAARTATEQQLVTIWEEILGHTGIGIRDNFFEWGGHSLKAARMVSRIHRDMGIRIELRSLFTHPTIEELGRLVEAAGYTTYKKITRVPEQPYYELSHAQRRLWILDQIEEDRVAYNMPACYYLEGNVDTKALSASLQEVINRHEILRTVFTIVDGEPWQKIQAPGTDGFALQIEKAATTINEDELINKLLTEEKQRPFDLERGPLLRSRLTELAPDRYVLLFNMHHIISDGWSVEVLVSELVQRYNAQVKGEPICLSSLPIQYRDYSAWQNQELASQQMQEHGRYWKERFKNGAPLLELPTDYVRPSVKTYRGATQHILLNKEISEGIRSLSLQKGTSVFISLLSAVKALLYRYTGQEDIVLGFPVSGRDHAELEDQIGFYVNTLALRTNFEGDKSFSDLLAKVNDTALEAYSHQAYPFDLLVEELDLARDMSRSPLFDMLIVLQNTGLGGTGLSDMEGVEVREVEADWGVSKFDLTWIFSETEAGIRLQVEYNADLYTSERITRLLQHYTGVWSAALSNTDQSLNKINYLSDEEQQQLTEAFNNTRIDYPKERTIQSLFEERVKQQPDRVAVVSGDTELTYGELNAKSNQLAHYLRRQHGIRRDMLVGVMVDRSEWMIVAIMGILKSGAAYVPIDPAYPADRKTYLLEDSAVQLLITDDEQTDTGSYTGEKINLRSDWDAINEGMPVSNGFISNEPHDLAYVIYTSGSTGNPKGVLIEHYNVVRLLFNEQFAFDFNADDTWTLFHSVCFDFSVWELFGCLLYGGRLVIVPKETAQSPRLFAGLLADEKVTVLNQVPGVFNNVIQEVLGQPELPALSLRYVIFGGEALNPAALSQWYNRYPETKLINMYGITETTVHTTYKEIGQTEIQIGDSNIGRAIPTVELYLTDKNGNLVPEGITGEILVGGLGVARGYLNRPELTTQKFISNPWKRGERLYRSGDLGRRLATGELVYMGRGDFQVKIRGYRIELGEIEDALLRYEGVRDAVVVARKDGEGDQYLAGYYVMEEGKEADETGLRSWLNDRLPSYMVPSNLVLMAALPLTSNGKVDRKALPAPVLTGQTDTHVAARTATEQQLATIWEEILGHTGIGIRDNFFEWGGHSLKAARMVSRIHRDMGIRIELRSLFTHPTIEELGRLVEAAGYTTYKKITRVPEQPYYELSHAQRRLWILDQIEEDRVAYNMPACYYLEGNVDTKALSASLQEVINRHEILRTVFTIVDGEPWQKIQAPGTDGFALQIEKAATTINEDELINKLLTEEKQRPFDLERGPLLRSRLTELAPDRYVLLFNMHHIISDGWSVEVLVSELVQRYNAQVKGEPICLSSLPIQYRDYSAWQNQELASQQMQEHGRYWKERFKNGAPLLELPTDYVRPSVKTYRGATQHILLNKEISEGIRSLSLQKGTSVFISLLSAVKALLYRYTGQEDIVLGFPVSGRDHAELEDQIGFYVNTLALRTNFEGDKSFSDLLAKVNDTALEAYSHQAYPFDLLVEELDLARDMSRSPLFDMLIVLQNTGLGGTGLSDMEGVEVREVEADWGVSKFDLTWIFSETEAGIRLQVEYNADLYTSERITRLLQHYTGVWSAALSNTDQSLNKINYLSDEEQQQLTEAFNNTRIDYPKERTIQSLFEERVKQQPDRVAVVSGDTELTYGELNAKSNQLAHYLRRQHGIRRDMLVGVMVDRSEWMIVAIMGILKSGAAYVPIDPEYPANRRRYMAEDSGIDVLLTEEKYIDVDWTVSQVDIRDTAIEKEIKRNPAGKNKSSDRAYIIYTSGTTGNPKGVQVTHRSVVNLSTWLNDIIYAQQPEPLRVTVTASISFDSSVKQLFPGLLNGSALVIISAEERKDPDLYIETLQKQEVNLLDITPSYLKIVIQKEQVNKAGLPALKYILSGGESLPNHVVEECNAAFEGECTLVNVYGVTEATVDSACEIITSPAQRKSQLSIGKPLHNTQLYILDAAGNILPVGIPGTLYIGGDGVADGYINREELTAEKFTPDTFTGSGYLYNTGDRAKWMADGTVEFLGRKDRQVKLRGYRIELGEIEKTISGYEAIKDTAVVVFKDKQGAEYLVGYFSEKSPVDIDVLRVWLATHLPVYMIPGLIMRVADFARTTNGKLDYAALPQPDQASTGNDYVAPSNDTEQALVAIWEEILDRKSIGIRDNFFFTGGDSLKAMKMFSVVYKKLGVRLAIKSIFVNPTIEYLAELIQAGQPTSYAPIANIPVQENYELSHSQKRLWILNQFEKDQTAYNIPVAYSFKGELLFAAFSKALSTLISRHEILRTSFTRVDGEPRQVVHPADQCKLAIEYIDARKNGKHDYTDTQAFDLGTAPLMRVRLVQTDDEAHTCYITIHHIISDAWSNNNLLKEISILYNAYLAGKPNPLPSLPVQYKDYAVWQKENLAATSANKTGQYWMSQFAQKVSLLELPTGKIRPRIKTFDGDCVGFDLTPTQVAALTALGNAHNATLFMVLVAVTKTLLYRYTSQKDIVITTPIAGREHPDLENQVGFYVNTLALRTGIDPQDAFTGVLSKVRETVLGAYTHQLYPFDMLTDKLDIPYDPSHAPLTEIMMVLQNAGQEGLQLDGLDVQSLELVNETSRFDLSVFFTLTGDAIRAELSYNTSVLDRKLVADMALHFDRLINSVIELPGNRISRLPLLTADETEQLVNVTGNKTDNNHSDIISLFKKQVARVPRQTAIRENDREISYTELDKLSDQLAAYITRHHFIEEGDRVGISLGSSASMVIATLGVWKAGATCIDTRNTIPGLKIKLFIDNGSVTTLVAGAPVLDISHTEIYGEENPVVISSRTSGSSALVISETNDTDTIYTYTFNDGCITSKAVALQNQFGISEADRWLLSADGLADTVYEITTALSGGAAVVFAAKTTIDNTITIASLTPYQLYRIADEQRVNDTYPGQLRYYMVSDGKLSFNRIKTWMENGSNQAAVINLYRTNITGPLSWHKVVPENTNAGQSLIGKPFAGMELLVLDEQLNPLPKGITGRIYAGVCANRPEFQDAAQLLPHPFKQGLWLLSTNDLAAYTDSWDINYINKRNEQVYLQGKTVGTGSLEEVLRQYTGIKDIYIEPNETQDNLLVAVTPSDDDTQHEQTPALIDGLKKYCNEQLPAFITSAIEWLELDELPLTATGKIDKDKIRSLAAGKNETTAPAKTDALVSATFTAEPMGDYLLWWAGKFGINLELRFSGYNQVFRDLLEPAKTPDIHILLVRFDDFIRDKDAGTSDEELISHLEETYTRLTNIISSRTGSATYIAGVGSLSPYLDYSERVLNRLKEITQRWADFIQNTAGIYSLDFEEIIAQYYITEVFDPGSDKLGHIPFTETFFAAMGTGLARKIRGLKKSGFKVIALDCDNTLWKGVCGEDGAEGVQVTGGYAGLQQFMLKKYEEGFLLVLNSKNNEADVWEVFEKNPGMLLKKEHFASWRINWNSKSANLKEMAAELSLDVSSFCFIDDSATECSEVMMNCPRALALQLPGEADHFADFLQHVWAFDKLEVTEEDKKRNEMYGSERKRQALKNEQGSVADFLSSLDLQVSMHYAEEYNLQRIAQLTERTNQFNLHKKQYSTVDIKTMLATADTRCWAITVQDKFGDYGLTGAVITNTGNDTLYVDTLLLSCRVLGRNVEQAILSGLKKYCEEKGITEIVADFWPTERNTPVARFLSGNGWTKKETTQDYTRYTLDVTVIPDKASHVSLYYNEKPATGSKKSTTKTGVALTLADKAFVPDHVGVAVTDIEKAGQYYLELGYTATDTIYDPIQNVHLAMFTHPGLQSVELIAPNDDTSPVYQLLQKNGDVPYHLCFRVRNFEQALRLLDTVCEYEIVSKPQKAVLFDGKPVMFISIPHAGLIELLEDRELTVGAPAATATAQLVTRMVTADLDKASSFYTRLGYYEDRISAHAQSRNYNVLLKHKYYASSLDIVMPGGQQDSPEDEFLTKNGSQPYQLAVTNETAGFAITNKPLYMTEWIEHNITGRTGGWEWNQRLVNEQELLHRSIYESLKYNSGKSLTRIPLYSLAADQKKENGHKAPKTATEEKLCRIWEEILHQENISTTDHFFKLGGNSIKATQVLSRIESQLGVEIALSSFFEHDTLAALAQLVEKSNQVKTTIQPVAAAEYYDVSNAQKRLWVASRLEKDQVTFNIPAAYCIEGKLNVKAMRQALTALVQRHESLRTTFTEIDGVPKQKIGDKATAAFDLGEIDLRDDADAVNKALALARAVSLTAFDLETGPLIKATLYRIEDEMYIFSQVVHHIIFDGWSVAVEMDDLLNLYDCYNEGDVEKALAPLRIQYKDYTAWEKDQLEGKKLATHRNYWLNQFDDTVPLLDLPCDYPRPAFKTNNGAISSFVLEPSLQHGVKKLINSSGASLFMLMIAGINGVLYRFSGQHDIVTGVPYSNRSHNDLENQVGFYVNILPVRTRFNTAGTFSTLLQQVKHGTLRAYDHGVYPFDRIIEDVQAPADMGRSPLFDVMIQMQHSSVQEIDARKQRNDFSITPLEIERGVSKYDLLFNIIESSSGIHVDIEYNTDLFKPTTIEKIKDNLVKLLAIVTENPAITLTELRKQLMGIDVSHQANYANRIVAEIEQDF